jgi:hypothetical protein
MVNYIKYGGLIVVSLLFMLFGIHVLVAAYRLKDPFSFVLSFFASNFIILISATLIAGFAMRFWRIHRPGAAKGPISHEEP